MGIWSYSLSLLSEVKVRREGFLTWGSPLKPNNLGGHRGQPPSLSSLSVTPAMFLPLPEPFPCMSSCAYTYPSPTVPPEQTPAPTVPGHGVCLGWLSP